MKQLISLLAFLLVFAATLFAQVSPQQSIPTFQKSSLQKSEAAVLYVPDKDQVWDVHMKNIGIRHGNPSDKSDFEKKKRKLTEGKRAYIPEMSEKEMRELANNRRNQAATPMLADDFAGNPNNGSTPPDNHMAISDSGFIVSVTNTRIHFYNEFGIQLSFASLNGFDGPLNVSAFAFDPRVIFDPDSKRFIMVWLAGTSSASSNIVLAVSRAQDPTKGWFLYALDATILNNSTWMDYPNLGVNENEIFISGNQFTDGFAYSQVLVYQVDKRDAIRGAALDFLTWSGANYANPSIFTLIPLSYGYNGTYGPEMHFLSNSFGPLNTLEMLTITDSIGGNPTMAPNVISVPNYNFPGNGIQPNSQEEVETGDNRLQLGFVSDTLAHVVFTTNTGEGFAGIYYARINLNDLSAQAAIYGQRGFDCAFPAVAPFANDPNDPTVLIGFLRTGETVFPQVRAVLCDANMDFSAAILVKKGTAPINTFINGIERWGDYSGIARRHNATNPEVWVAGCFANPSDGFMDTWIGKINNQAAAPQSPLVDFTSTNPTIGVGQSIQYSDESTRNPQSWSWSFPGGVPNSSTNQNPLIRYDSVGVYPVTLTVSNSVGDDSVVANAYVTVTALPITDFAASQLAVAEGMTIDFADLSGNAPSSWFWIFDGGDPGISFDKNPAGIQYNQAGTYDVTLSASNVAGSNSEEKVGYITVVPLQRPVADFGALTTVVSPGGPIQFVDSSQNFPTSWNWLLPGGVPDSSNEQNPLVRYDVPGTYNVTLSVNNAAGTDLEIKNAYITVLNPTSIEDPNIESITLFPNPVKDGRAQLEFYLEKGEWLSFQVLDLKGSLVKVLGEDWVKAGQNRLTFTTSALSEGTYLINITDKENNVRYSEKLVVLP